MALLLETYRKPHSGFFIPNYLVYWTHRFQWLEGGTAVTVRKGIPHNHVDLPPLASVETTEICIPVGNSEFVLAAVYTNPGRTQSNANIIMHLSFRNK